MSKDLTVANTIVQQLGGFHFQMMTGAKNFVGGDDFVQFTLPGDITDTRKVRITLTPADVYRVEFYRDGEFEPFEVCEDIYCDTLTDTFERVTRLYTSLTPRRKVHHFVDKKA